MRIWNAPLQAARQVLAAPVRGHAVLPPRMPTAAAAPQAQPPAAPEPPEEWPHGCTQQALLRFLTTCSHCGPEHFVTALHQAYSHIATRSQARAQTLIDRTVARYGTARLVAPLRHSSTMDGMWIRPHFFAYVARTAPQWLAATLRPDDLEGLAPLVCTEVLQKVFVHLPGDMDAWARTVFASRKARLPVAFVEASLTACWRAQISSVAEHLPRALGTLLLQHHPQREALSAWQRSTAALTPDDVRTLCTHYMHSLDNLGPAMLRALQGSDDPQPLWDAAVPELWNEPLEVGETLLDWGLHQGLQVASAVQASNHESLPCTALWRILRQLPASQIPQLQALPMPAKHFDHRMQGRDLLDLLTWMRQHNFTTLEAWRREAARRCVQWSAPQAHQRQAFVRLIAHQPHDNSNFASLARRHAPQLHNLRRASMADKFAAYGVDPDTTLAWLHVAEADDGGHTERMAFIADLGPHADPAAQRALQALPSCVRALLTLPPGEGGAHVLPATPTVVLHAIVKALQQSDTTPPLCVAVLQALEAHTDLLTDAQRLQLGALAQQHGLSVWPWLEHLANNRSKALLDPWCALLTQQTHYRPQDLRTADNHRGWINDVIGYENPWRIPLVQWLTAHPDFPQDANWVLSQTWPGRDDATICAYARSRPAHTWPDLIVSDRYARFMPPEAAHLYAMDWLSDSPPSFADSLPLQHLVDCIRQRSPEAEDTDAAPELLWVCDPNAVLQGGPTAWEPLLQATAAPAWLRAILQQEAHAQDPFARDNRLRAVGRFLYACRMAAVPNARRDAAAPIVAQLLALPHVDARHTLLMRLVGKVLAPDAPVLAELLKQPARAMPLTLATWLCDPALSNAPAVHAMLHNRAVYGNGARVHAFLDLLLDTDSTRKDAFAHGVITWANDANMQAMLNNQANRQARRDLLAAAQNAGPNNASALHVMVSRYETLCATRSALIQDGAGAPAPDAAALQDLTAAFTWLATRPAWQPIAQAALASMNAPPAPDAGAHLRRLRTACKDVPKQDRWLRPYADVLLQDMHSLRPAVARRAAPSAQLFNQQAVRTFMQEHVLPLMLELIDNAELVRQAGKQPADFAQAGDVALCALDWTQLPTEQLRPLGQRWADLTYLTTYVSAMAQSWPQTRKTRGMAMLRAMVAAQSQNSLDAWRRGGAQATKLLQAPGGAALMQAWEHCTPQTQMLANTPGGPTQPWTIADTGDPAAMLSATTQVSSCQSASSGGYNHGMLSRMRDGAKRMVVLKDQRGHVQVRAALRLMHHQGQPVLLLSRAYGGVWKNQDFGDVLRLWVAERASQLGIPAYAEGGDGVCRNHEFTCAGDDLADYWDEGYGNMTGAVSLHTYVSELKPSLTR